MKIDKIIKSIQYEPETSLKDFELWNQPQGLLRILFEDGTDLIFTHQQDCCESVWFDKDSSDTLDYLDDETLLEITKESSVNSYNNCNEENLWTFYKLKTTDGDYTLLFRGNDNGYYSLSVDIYLNGEEIDVTEEK